MKCAGLIFDDSFHYIDHLAPFCAGMGWPLIVCEGTVADLCRQFYPDLEVIERDVYRLELPETIISCDNRALLDWTGWRGRFLWLPHGLSDKGWKSPFFEALGREDLLLVYGQRMRDILQAKNVSLPQISIGNFRWHYFCAHKAFYENLMESRFGQKRFVLYAPTWEDSENNGTFWDAFPKLVKADLPLLIKVHPNTEKRFAPKLERCRGMATFADDWPPIYPLLSRSDAYIGDMSSIGYDFLPFQRPLYFLRREKTDAHLDPSAFLMRCGEQILLDDIPHLQFDRKSADTQGLLRHAFDETPWEAVQKLF